ncbi:aminoacyl-tRNA hydrolase [bacterium]|nr:aminoacyl-tRNA hydrolase [bacterium]
MPYIIAGLGNPEGDQKENYSNTRHNTGRDFVRAFSEAQNFSKFAEDKKIKALTSHGMVGTEKVMLVLPDNFMNNSGKSLISLVKTKKAAEKLVVIYDDLDLPLGSFKISFNRGSGGHRGLDSVIKSLKTREFVRIRVGISSSTTSGKLKKPTGEEKVLKFILGKYKKEDLVVLKKLSKKINQALETIITEGREKAMGEWN